MNIDFSLGKISANLILKSRASTIELAKRTPIEKQKLESLTISMNEADVLRELEEILRANGYLDSGETIPVVRATAVSDDTSLTGQMGVLIRDNTISALSVRFGDLEVVPESLGLLANMRQLDLTGNRLSSLPESLGNLKKLRSLYLDNNQ